MLDLLLVQLSRHWAIGLSTLVLLWLVRNYFQHGLQKYPGPLAARFTDLWRFFDVLGRRPDITHNDLHRRHGDIVRLGPNTLSFANPEAVKTIYGLNKGFVKSGFYPVQQSTSKGRRLPSLFSTVDNAWHAQLRRHVNSAFSMSSMIKYEAAIAKITSKFLDRTEQLFTSPANSCDFARWLQFYAFDVVGQVTYSKDHGFIDENRDIDGIVAFLSRLFSYVAPVGQLPFLDVLLLKNPLLRLLQYYDFSFFQFPVTAFAKARMAERISRTSEDKAESQSTDLLSEFLRFKAKDPAWFGDDKVLTMAVSMTFAGSDTTAITLSSIFYYIAKHSEVMSRLRAELDAAVQDGRLESRSDGLTSWSGSQRLPYLDAVIKESFRMHPAVGLPLERIVPPGGLEICGERIQAGTIVGCSAWVLHRREDVFGADADVYRPERWLDGSSDRKKMEATMFQFGAGSRTCIGKNISLLEAYTVVPSFLRRFDIHLVNPEGEWKIHNAWFVKQLNFLAYFTVREVTMRE